MPSLSREHFITVLVHFSENAAQSDVPVLPWFALYQYPRIMDVIDQDILVVDAKLELEAIL
jgi:hypothetical protein